MLPIVDYTLKKTKIKLKKKLANLFLYISVQTFYESEKDYFK